jgi:hypothetical protein
LGVVFVGVLHVAGLDVIDRIFERAGKQFRLFVLFFLFIIEGFSLVCPLIQIVVGHRVRRRGL